MISATLVQVCGPARVRLAQLAAQFAALEAAGLPTERVEYSILDLAFGLEVAAQLPNGPDLDAVLGYLIENYGLLAVATDPLLRPLLPPIPATGAVVRRLVLGIGGAALRANAALIGLGAELQVLPASIV